MSYAKEYKYQPYEEKFKESVEKIMEQDVAKELNEVVKSFNNFRNDIDHCGFCEGARSPDNLRKEINKAYEKIKEIL